MSNTKLWMTMKREIRWQGELQAGGKGKKRAVGWFPASCVKLLAGDASGATENGEGGEKPVLLLLL